MTLLDTPSAISSPESGAGPTPSNWPDGRQTDLFGPAVVPASPSRRQGREKEKPTNATSGPSFDASSPSAILQRALASRLEAVLAETGSPLFALTWKRWDMPSGPPICARRGSALRTSANGSTSWPTPTTSDDAQDMVKRAIRGAKWGFGPALTLGTAARLMASWPTPTALDSMQTDGTPRPSREATGRTTEYLARMAHWLSPRATASARDWKDSPGMAETGTNPDGSERTRLDQLPRQAALLGPTPSGSPVETGKSARYLLNPAFSLWLMGYPADWFLVGMRVTVIRSRKASRTASGS